MVTFLKNIKTNVLKPTSNYIKRFEKNFYMGMHNHKYIEMMYSKEGYFTIEFLENEKDSATTLVTVHQGSLIFLNSYVFHRLKIPEYAVIYNVELEPTSLNEYNPYNVNSFFSIDHKSFILNTPLSSVFSEKYHIIPDLSNIENAFRNLIFSLSKLPTQLEDVLTTQLSLFSFFNEILKSMSFLKDNDNFFTKRTYLYIKNHLSQPLTLDAIAKSMGYHKSYLTAQFKKMIGKSVMQLVCLMRISKSLQLLRETNLSVDQIAKQVGFSNYHKMFYAFKTHVGISPTDCQTTLY